MVPCHPHTGQDAKYVMCWLDLIECHGQSKLSEHAISEHFCLNDFNLENFVKLLTKK